MAGMSTRAIRAAGRVGGLIASALVLAVIVFDLVFVWLRPTSELGWALWIAFLFGGNAAILAAMVYYTGYLGPLRVLPPAR